MVDNLSPFESKNNAVTYTQNYSADTWTVSNVLKDLNNKCFCGTIYWYDESNALHLRPKNITITLYKIDPKTGTVTSQKKNISVGTTDCIDYAFDNQAAINS